MGTDPKDGRSEAQVANALGVGRYQRHILLCVGPNCCNPAEGLSTWTFLKGKLRELERTGKLPRMSIYRTKAGCLRICRGGPILIVYPEGVWYRHVTPEICERILNEHIGRGQVVEEYAFAFNSLLPPTKETSQE